MTPSLRLYDHNDTNGHRQPPTRVECAPRGTPCRSRQFDGARARTRVQSRSEAANSRYPAGSSDDHRAAELADQVRRSPCIGERGRRSGRGRGVGPGQGSPTHYGLPGRPMTFVPPDECQFDHQHHTSRTIGGHQPVCRISNMTVSPTSHTPVSVQLNQRFAVGDIPGGASAGPSPRRARVAQAPELSPRRREQHLRTWIRLNGRPPPGQHPARRSRGRPLLPVRPRQRGLPAIRLIHCASPRDPALVTP